MIRFERAFGPAVRDRLAAVLVLGLCLFTLTWGLGSYGLYEPHEGHFAGVGREMLLTGDWLVPHLNGSPYLNKPPLMYWSVAACNYCFGINEFSARLPAALCGFLAVAAAFVWAREIWGGALAGRLAAVFLTVSAGWFLFTHQAMTDLPLSAQVFISLWLFWRCLRAPEERLRWLALYISIAIGLLIKGPVAGVLAALPCVAFILIRRRRLLWKSGLWWGAPLVCAPLLLWCWAVEARHPGFFRHFFIGEHFERLQDVRWPQDYGVSKIGPLGYLAAAALWCAPWSLLLPQIAGWAWTCIRRPRTTAPGETMGTDAEEAEYARNDAILLLALAAIMPVLLFLPVPSRLVYYGLPSVPPFAMLAALWWTRRDFQPAPAPPESVRPPRRLVTVLSGGWFALAGLAALISAFWLPGLLRKLPELTPAPDLPDALRLVAVCAGAGLFAGGALLCRGRRATWAAALLVCGLGLASVLAVRGFAAYQDIRSSKNLARALDGRLGPDAVWIMEGSHELGASAGTAYYLGVDGAGKPRTVRVMIDDRRRPQPEFPGAIRAYGMKRTERQLLWDSDRPAVFVTDLMRRDFVSEEQRPFLPEGAGEPIAHCGFRRLYANAAARARLYRDRVEAGP